MDNCKELIDLSLKMSAGIKKKIYDQKAFQSVKECLNKLIAMSGKIIPELSDKTKDLAKLLRDEISDMDSAINEAALRIEVYYHPLAPKVSNSCYSTANARNGQEERHWNQIGGQRTDFGCVHLPDECHQTIDSRFQTTQSEIVSQGKVQKQ